MEIVTSKSESFVDFWPEDPHNLYKFHMPKLMSFVSEKESMYAHMHTQEKHRQTGG